MPARLATVEGLTFDAADLPATAGTDVGGDWYDTFETGSGLIGISVGDVVGYGLEAAVAMSEIRSAIRVTAAMTTSPLAVLRTVDDIMCAQGIGMATAIVGFYDPHSGVLRYASCGYPAPALLCPSGKTGFLPAGGLMLGIGSGNADDITVTIPRGATLVLCTDGFRGGVKNADDCATLAIHRLEENETMREHLVYSAIAPCAGLAREALRQFSERFLSEQDRCFEMLSAVGEAVANAIEHGAQGDHTVFEIDALACERELIVEIRNRGHWRSFTPSIDRGRGLHIMRSYAQKLEISSTQNETRVKLTFV